MRFFPVLASLAVLLAAASATDLKIRVIDPQSAAVSGAQVQLAPSGNSTPIAVQETSSEGIVIFHDLAKGTYQLKVLAAGFAVASEDVSPSNTETTIKLRLAVAAETVQVTATRTPVPTQNCGADVSVLSSEQLDVMQPMGASDAIRFLPGAVINTAGQTGGLASLFVRGGNSNYNKVIVDGVSFTEPGGTFDFGTLPLSETDRLEFLRGAQSTLYGSDAMTSVVQVFTKTGTTPVPELTFGADAGNYDTQHGYASLAGAHGMFDYDVFADQFNTMGRGPNDAYSNSLEGLNVGAKLNQQIALRLRARHDNAITGVQDEWNFNGDPLLAPDLYEKARQNNFLGSFEMTITGPSRWTHQFTGFEASLERINADPAISPGRIAPVGEVDFVYADFSHFNRAGFDYQGNYVERSWTQTTIGYEFEDENGTVNDAVPAPPTIAHGLRRNQALYGQQELTLKRLTVVAGARFVHNTTFGNAGTPRIALAYQMFHGGQTFSGTRLKFSYTTGIKEPRFEETFGIGPFQIPNPDLKAERNRAFETGFQQGFFSNKMVLDATYFNNLFHDQIEFVTINPETFVGQYINLEKSLAHGAEVELQSRISSKISWNNSYTYTSTQIIHAPPGTAPPYATDDPLLRRPHHSAQSLLSYLGKRWGANLGANYVGWRPDSDFGYGYNINHAPSYTLVNTGGWYALTSRVTAYVTINNVLNKQYNEVVGYPALRANFRAGMKFRIGGE